MVKTVVLNRVDEGWWDGLVGGLLGGNIFQTARWAEYTREFAKEEPIYLLAKEDGKEVGLLLLRKEGFLQRTLMGLSLAGITVPICKKLIPEYSWMYGPLIIDTTNREEVFESILEKVESIVIKERGHIIKEISFPIHGDDAGWSEAIFRKKGFIPEEHGTFLVDVSPDTETLWKNLKQSARKAINKCISGGVSVERVEEEKNLDEYCRLLVETRKMLGLGMVPYFPNRIMWKYLKGGENLEIFIARKEGKIIAGLGVLVFNGIVFEIGSARSAEATREKIYGGDLIKWEIIKWAHEKKIRIYDLAGVSLHPRDEKEISIRQFKEKWGGRLIKFNTYSKTYPNIWKKILGSLRRMGRVA